MFKAYERSDAWAFGGVPLGEASTFHDAKKLATRERLFKGTTFVIEHNNVPVAYKRGRKRWVSLVRLV